MSVERVWKKIKKFWNKWILRIQKSREKFRVSIQRTAQLLAPSRVEKCSSFFLVRYIFVVLIKVFHIQNSFMTKGEAWNSMFRTNLVVLTVKLLNFKLKVQERRSVLTLHNYLLIVICFLTKKQFNNFKIRNFFQSFPFESKHNRPLKISCQLSPLLILVHSEHMLLFKPWAASVGSNHLQCHVQSPHAPDIAHDRFQNIN